MADQIDLANEIATAHADRAIAAARADVSGPEPTLGSCEACVDDDVWVKPCGGMLRCTPCRLKWEKRR